MNLGDIIRRLSVFLVPYKKWIFQSITFTFIASLLNTISPFLIRYTINIAYRPRRIGNFDIAEFLSVVFLIFLLKEICYFILSIRQKFVSEEMRSNIAKDLNQSVLKKILCSSGEFFIQPDHLPGELQSNIDHGIAALTNLTQIIFLDFIPLLLNAVVSIGIMLFANAYIGLATMVIIPLYLHFSFLQAKKLKGVWSRHLSLRAKQMSALYNIISSIFIIKSFGRERFEASNQEEIHKDIINTQMKFRRTNYYFDGVKIFIEQLGVMSILMFSLYFVLNGMSTIGELMFNIFLFNNFSGPFRQLHRSYDQINESIAFSKSFFEILDSREVEKSGKYKGCPALYDLRTSNLNFSYANGKSVIKDVTMVIPHSKTTAIVGLSGSGKSTILNLLCRFYLPTSGTIFLNSKDICDYNIETYRKYIGFVLQKTHIFQGRIDDNLRYGKYEASHEEMVEAAKKAYLHHEIIDLPEKYRSDASALSVGQQQRLSIARLFLKDPPIVCLDEPTASLDAISIEKIRKSIAVLRKDKTIVVISHDLYQIMDADVIYVLRSGEVVEVGTHQELMQMKGYYFQMFHISQKQH